MYEGHFQIFKLTNFQINPVCILPVKSYLCVPFKIALENAIRRVTEREY